MLIQVWQLFLWSPDIKMKQSEGKSGPDPFEIFNKEASICLLGPLPQRTPQGSFLSKYALVQTAHNFSISTIHPKENYTFLSLLWYVLGICQAALVN